MTFSSLINESDHRQGEATAPVTLIQYGDFECPFSGAAYPAIRALQDSMGEQLCYVFRSFPLHDIHPHALHAALAAEAAGSQDKFWPMYDLLFLHQDELEDADLLVYAQSAGLDEEQFARDMTNPACLQQVMQSIAGGKAGGAQGTPTFFINGQLHHHREKLWTLSRLMAAVEDALDKG